MKKSFIPIQKILFDIFANEYINPQSYKYIWAIEECLNRLPIDHPFKIYKTQNARKDHACIRECSIKMGDVYITEPYFNGKKLCIKCAAMIMYFANYWSLFNPFYFDHWDDEKQEPICISDKHCQNYIDIENAVEKLID